MSKILIINGPNLNLLGKRDNLVYGKNNYNDLVNMCTREAIKLNLVLHFKQSNSEGEIINWIQEADSIHYKAIIINPGAYAHTSIAIMDAILDCNITVIEVHISNIYARESFRNHSYTAKTSTGVISGFGLYGYILALYAVAKN